MDRLGHGVAKETKLDTDTVLGELLATGQILILLIIFCIIIYFAKYLYGERTLPIYDLKFATYC